MSYKSVFSFLRIQLHFWIRIPESLISSNWRRSARTSNLKVNTAVHLNFVQYRTKICDFLAKIFSGTFLDILDAQATREAFSPLNSVLFSIFVAHFCPPGSGSSNSNECGSIPDPQPWYFVCMWGKKLRITNVQLFMHLWFIQPRAKYFECVHIH